MEIFVAILLFGGAGLIIWGFFAFLWAIAKGISNPTTPRNYTPASDDIDGMNNGDYYNGPHGYSPMTGYPETQYDSGFNPDAEWNHEEDY
jgi:hypothetical protein